MEYIDLSIRHGLKEASEGFHEFKILKGLTREEYTLFLVVFTESNDLGIFIWNDFNNTFYEEPIDIETGFGSDEDFLDIYPYFTETIEEFHRENP